MTPWRSRSWGKRSRNDEQNGPTAYTDQSTFIAGLAHDLEGLHAHVATLTHENETLKHETNCYIPSFGEAGARPMEQATDPAASVFKQAHWLAYSLIDEAMQAARDLL